MHVPPSDALSLRHRVFIDTMREHGFGIEARPVVVERHAGTSTWPAHHASQRCPVSVATHTAPDDVAGMFRALREKHLKFVRMDPTMTARKLVPESSAAVAHDAATTDLVAAEYLRKHTFASALVDSVQPYSRFIGTPGERVRVVTRFISSAVVGMTADVPGLVKRFRKATGTKHLAISEDAMRAALYDTNTLYDDDHLSDIVIFHTAETLKMVIVVITSKDEGAAGEVTRIFPPDASLRDRAMLLTRSPDGKFTLEGAPAPGAALIDVLKTIARSKSIGRETHAPLASMKADELRAFANARFGLTGKQVAELEVILRRNVPDGRDTGSDDNRPASSRVTKAVLRDALGALMASED